MYALYKPGSLIVKPLGGVPGATVVLKTLGRRDGAKAMALILRIQESVERLFSEAPELFALCVDRIEGVELEGVTQGGVLKLEPGTNGRIPDETMDLITPIAQAIFVAIACLVSIREDEQKNS